MNKIYFNAMQETDKVKPRQFLTINNEQTGVGDKISLEQFISGLGIITTNTLPPVPNTLVELTYSQAQTEVTNSTLEPGTHYKITDKADLGIILLATATNQFSLEGQGIFLNPDFQYLGDYSNTPVPYTTNNGVWDPSLEPGATDGLVVFWDGMHYQVIDQTQLNGTDPSLNTNAYQLLPKTSGMGYVQESDFILFDFSIGEIIWQEDKRLNKWNPYNVTSFQRGNDAIYGVYVHPTDADIDCINQRGTLSGVFIALGSLYLDSTHTGLIEASYIGGNTRLHNTTFTINDCVFDISLDIHIQANHSYKRIDGLGSTFNIGLDLTNPAIFTGGTLTISADYNYIGIFILTKVTMSAINKIINLPTEFKSRFYIGDGLAQTFTHTAIGSAIANNLVSDAAASNVIVGRTDGGDFIEYEKAGNLNRRANAVIML